MEKTKKHQQRFNELCDDFRARAGDGLLQAYLEQSGSEFFAEPPYVEALERAILNFLSPALLGEFRQLYRLILSDEWEREEGRFERQERQKRRLDDDALA